MLCFAIVFGSTIFASTTASKFTFCGPIPFALGFLFGTFGIMYLVLGGSASLFHGLIGAVLFTLYFIGDTILLLKGASFCFQLTSERHLLCAVSLYLDVVNIFVYLLALLQE